MSETKATYDAGETMAEIKHCPYCHGEDKMELRSIPGLYATHCGWCNATGPTADNAEDAILLHNTAADALEAAKRERDAISDQRDDFRSLLLAMTDERDALKQKSGKCKYCEAASNALRVERQALEAANAQRDEAKRINADIYPKFLQLKEDIIHANEKTDEAKEVADLRLRDCETMAEEVEKYKGILQAERQSFIACGKDLLAQRDEARKIARRLWREKADNWQISGRMICI